MPRIALISDHASPLAALGYSKLNSQVQHAVELANVDAKILNGSLRCSRAYR